MNTALEAGYLLELFNEPLYLMGYQSNEKISEVDSVSAKIEIPLVHKQEVKPVTVVPKLQTTSSKIVKKCILLFYSEENELTPKELDFLAKVMTAAKLTSEEYDCVNFKGITITDVASRYSFDKLVLFGVKIPNLELSPYTLTQVKSTKIISAEAVWMVEANNSLKKLLWQQLQQMFNLL